jgi:hypothetical protein
MHKHIIDKAVGLTDAESMPPEGSQYKVANWIMGDNPETNPRSPGLFKRSYPERRKVFPEAIEKHVIIASLIHQVEYASGNFPGIRKIIDQPAKGRFSLSSDRQLRAYQNPLNVLVRIILTT